MITSFFLNFLYSFLTFLIDLLPLGGTFPASWITGINTIWANINVFSFIVPVDVLVTCLLIAMSFHLFIFSWNAIHWILSVIRGYKH